jgi:hypothetical protein
MKGSSNEYSEKTEAEWAVVPKEKTRLLRISSRSSAIQPEIRLDPGHVPRGLSAS